MLKELNKIKNMVGDIISLIDFLKKNYLEYSVKSAIFSSEGVRMEGDELIEIEKIPSSSNARIWFYKIREVDGYEFVYMPVIPSLSIDYGQLHNEQNPNSNIFRFVGNSMSTFTSGGLPNVTANFIVFGYKPKDLLSTRKNK